MAPRNERTNEKGGPGGGLWNGPIFTSVVQGEDDGGPVTAVTFVGREGEGLPGVAG